ncbi:MAG: GntR family transcriptional regulator [Candidatus Dormiibacterota bacterium]
MALKQIQLPGRRSRADELYEYLRHAIMSGRLAANERLVEQQIASRASVSRTPVREAIRKLEVDGLVRQTRAGVIVVQLSDTELRELCEVRVVLEGLACWLAAESRSLLDLQVLDEIRADYATAVAAHDINSLVKANLAFHETIWRMANSKYLSNQLRELRSRIQGLQASTLAVAHRQSESRAEHDQIVNSIRDRDADAAERIARVHFRHAMVLRLMPNVWDREDRSESHDTGELRR